MREGPVDLSFRAERVSMRQLLRGKAFWATVAVVVPFGWVILLIRLAARAISR
ncbi:MAG: hypothetical protein ACREM3_07555 [Candidatus Rokuibacteriota bacterium]